MKLKTFILIILGAAIGGCANPINQVNANKYWQAAESARSQGNWNLARENWSRAIVNGKLGGIKQRNLSVAYYEYARASGVLCDWVEAEKGLKKSLEIDRKTSGPVHYPLIELARLNLDQKNYNLASDYFKEALDVLEKLNVETKDPLGFADLYDEYSESVEKSSNHDESISLRKRAKELRAAFPNGKSHTDRTPYGTQCFTS